MHDPLVSVIVPTYNRSSLLPRALESVLEQTIEDWELLVIDDGSIDDTPEIVRHLAPRFGGRLRYHRRGNGGSSSARNTGIDLARGRFICFLDSDDAFVPLKLERQLQLFSMRPELGLVYSDFSAMSVTGESLGRAFDTNCRAARSVDSLAVGEGLYICRGDLFSHLLSSYFIATIVGMVRRDVLGDTIRFAPDVRYAEEWLFYLEVVRRCEAGFVDESLSIHYHTQGSVTRTDKQRNVAGAYAIVRSVADTFQSLTPDQRSSLSRELSRTALQMGYDLCREGRSREALAYFREAFGFRPGRQTARALAGGVWRAASQVFGGRGSIVDTAGGGQA